MVGRVDGQSEGFLVGLHEGLLEEGLKVGPLLGMHEGAEEPMTDAVGEVHCSCSCSSSCSCRTLLQAIPTPATLHSYRRDTDIVHPQIAQLRCQRLQLDLLPLQGMLVGRWSRHGLLVYDALYRELRISETTTTIITTIITLSAPIVVSSRYRCF
jgi:hypothetical protein